MNVTEYTEYQNEINNPTSWLLWLFGLFAVFWPKKPQPSDPGHESIWEQIQPVFRQIRAEKEEDSEVKHEDLTSQLNIPRGFIVGRRQ